MSTLKANKDKARFISNTISQDVEDGDWIDHEVVTKYKLPEIVVDASTTESLLVSTTEITTGDKLKVLDGASIVERAAGTITVSETTAPFTTIGTDLTGTNGGLTVTATGHAGDANNNAYLPLVSSNSFFKINIILKSVKIVLGISTGNTNQSTQFGHGANDWGYSSTGDKINGGTVLTYGDSYTTNDDIAFAYNYDNGEVTFYKNGVSQGVAYTIAPNTAVYPAVHVAETSSLASVKPLLSEIPSGFNALYFDLYQAPITATTNIPTKAYFNKTIDTTLSAEATDKCKSSTITQIGVL